MAHNHPIVDQLHDRRVARRLTMSEVARAAGIHRNSIHTHEIQKFSALDTLDRWARALGYRLVLVDDDRTETRASDWHIR